MKEGGERTPFTTSKLLPHLSKIISGFDMQNYFLAKFRINSL